MNPATLEASAENVSLRSEKADGNAKHLEELPRMKVTPEEHRRVRRKIDMILMPIMLIAYGLLCIDKNVYGTGAVVGMTQDLGLIVTTGYTADGKAITDSGRYSNGSMIFWVGFAVGSYPLMWLAQRFPIGKCCSFYVFLWGAILSCTPAVKNYAGIMTLRFFQGVLESGISPAYSFMCAMFYLQNEQSLRVAVWVSGGVCFQAIGYLINYGLCQIHTTSLALWKIPFLFWGIFTILFGIVSYFVLPDSPDTMRWLTERERQIAVETLRANQDSLKNIHFKKEQLYEGILDIKVWLQGLIIFTLIINNGLGTTFVPLIVSSLGFTGTRSLLLSSPYSAFGGLFGLLGGYIGQRFKGMRCHVLNFYLVLTLIGVSMLYAIPRTKVAASMVGLYLSGFYASSLAISIGLVPSNTAGSTKRTFASGVFFILYCLGNIAGPLIMLPKEAPTYASGMKALIICTTVCIGLTYIYRFILWRENKRRNNLGDEGKQDRAFQDLTDKQNLSFRYST